MNKSFKLILSLLALLTFITACSEDGINGRGPIVEQERSTDEFTALHLQIPAKLYVYEGTEPNVRIRTNENLHKYIETTVVNGELRIETTPNVWIRNANSMSIYVTSDLVSQFTINGSGLIAIEDCLDVASASFQINGSGDIYACGATDVLKVVVNGSGKFKGHDLQAESAEVEIRGSGDIETRVNQSLEADISGSGKVEYYGNPQIFTQISGSGKVKKK